MLPYGHRAADVKLAHDAASSLCIHRTLFPCLKKSTQLVTCFHTFNSQCVSFVDCLYFKDGCGEEDMSCLELFIISLSHFLLFIMDVEHKFSKSLLAVVFWQFLNWVESGAPILWDITILWHAADSSAFLQSLLSSGGESRKNCVPVCHYPTPC